MIRRYALLLILLVPPLGLSLITSAGAQSLDLQLPTDNHALLRGAEQEFYMYTDRTFEGQRSRPWQGGKYGFWRNPQRTTEGLIFTRFHGGIDIQPEHRDPRNEPLDRVRAIDEGTVVYVNNHAGHSTYGMYVVIEHEWSNSPFYSLYAHLNRTDVQAGDYVAQGDTLGVLGYTGRGINQRRAHLHLEVNMLLSNNFQDWFDEHLSRATNRHGIYNGLNMRAIDVANLFRATRANPTLNIGRFVTQKESFFTVRVPIEQEIEMLQRYPWMLREGERNHHNAWEIIFTQGATPIGVRPVEHEGRLPAVSLKEPSRASCGALTSGFLAGSGSSCRLSASGQRTIDLMTRDPSGATAGTPSLPGRR